jgi:hypothetical protein
VCENPSHWLWAHRGAAVADFPAMTVLSVMQFTPPIGACLGGVSEKPCQLEVRRVCRRCNSTAGTMHECRYENAFRGPPNLTSMHMQVGCAKKLCCMICFKRSSHLHTAHQKQISTFRSSLCLSKSLHPVYRLASGVPAVG